MLRQVSSRNQKSKGFKVKYVLQIGLLVAICIWLLYQVKHSHEKKRVFEERNSRILFKVDESHADFFNFGRKDFPHNKETGSLNEIDKEDEDDTQGGHDTRQQETEDEEGTGAVVDEIDVQDQERADEDAQHREVSTEEEDKDNRDAEKNGRYDEKDGHDEVDLFHNQEHEGGTQEAREENYKRDDASSAVVHDNHETESENGSEDARDVDEKQVIHKVDENSANNANNAVGDDALKSQNVVVVSANNATVGDDTLKSQNVVDISANNATGGDDAVKSQNSRVHDENSRVHGSEGEDDTSVDSSKSEVVEENLLEKVVESENVTNGTDDGSVSIDTALKDKETIQTDNILSNTTVSDNKDIGIDNKDVDVNSAKTDNGSVSNSATVEYNSHMEQQTNLTTAAESNGQIERQTNLATYTANNRTAVQITSTMVDAVGIPTSNDTASLDSAQRQNISAKGEDALESQNVMDISANNAVGDDALKSQNVVVVSANNATVGDDTLKSQNVVDISANNATGGDDAVKSQNVVDISVNTLTTGEDAFKSQNVMEPAEESNLTTASESEEHSSITSTNELGEFDNSSSHSVITKEESDVRTDLSTLPDIQNEVTTTDEEAAK